VLLKLTYKTFVKTELCDSVAEDTIVGLKSEEVSYEIISEKSYEIGSILIVLGCDLL